MGAAIADPPGPSGRSAAAPPPADNDRRGWTRISAAALAACPSRADGISADQEAAWRAQYCVCIHAAGQKLRMSPLAIVTATHFCNRFFAVRSMARNNRFVVATACLFLAGKVEETPKALSDVVRTMHAYRFEAGVPGGPAAGATVTVSPAVAAAGPAAAADPAYAAGLCEAVRTAERGVMYALGFELRVRHPFEAMVAVVRGLDLCGGNGGEGGVGVGGATPATPAHDGCGGGATPADDGGGGGVPSAPPPAPHLAPPPPRPVILQQGVNLTMDASHTLLPLSYSPEEVAGGVVLAVLSLLGVPRLRWRGCGGGGGATPASQHFQTPGTPAHDGGGGGVADDGGPSLPWWEAPPLRGVSVAAMGEVAAALMERYAAAQDGKRGEAG